jgi:DNA-binding transcriptional ArsR family regulator
MDSRGSEPKRRDLGLLGILESEVRVEILKILLEFEFRSLTDIAGILDRRGWKMTLSGVLKHMRELENAGLVRTEPGIFSDTPDARKTMYFLEGRARVEQLLQRLEIDVMNPLVAGLLFSETGKLAREIEGTKRGLTEKEKERLNSLLVECESKEVFRHLTDDEKKKLKLWRMMMSMT